MLPLPLISTSDNAEDCIRSAARAAWPSRRASSALRIQLVGLNRGHNPGYGASFFVGSMLAFWIAGFTADWRPALAGWAAGILLIAYAESVFPGGGFGEFLFTALIQTGVWTGAFVLARRTRHAHVLAADLVSACAAPAPPGCRAPVMAHAPTRT